jgi:hypothetical protein
MISRSGDMAALQLGPEARITGFSRLGDFQKGSKGSLIRVWRLTDVYTPNDAMPVASMGDAGAASSAPIAMATA